MKTDEFFLVIKELFRRLEENNEDNVGYFFAADSWEAKKGCSMGVSDYDHHTVSYLCNCLRDYILEPHKPMPLALEAFLLNTDNENLKSVLLPKNKITH